MLLEIGMNAIELTYYPAIFDRSFTYFWKFAAQKFEERWFSGEWTDELPSDFDIDISQCIQPLPEGITREFKVTTENFNITTKMSDFRFRVPAPISANAMKCSDIIVKIADCVLVAASALPSEFLSDEIFSTDGEEKMTLPDTSSNIRIQMIMNGFEVEVTPSPMYRSTKDPHKVLYLRAFTFLGSYDRVERDMDPVQYYLFLSLRLHHVEFNIDFDILYGAISTINYILSTTGTEAVDNKAQPQARDPGFMSKLPEELQIKLRLSLSKVDCRVWRQNVPVTISHIAIVPCMPLIHLDVENLELGSKGHLRLSSLLLGSNLSFIAVEIGKLRLSAFELIEKKIHQSDIDGSGLIASPEFMETEIVSVGERCEPDEHGNDTPLSFSLRTTSMRTCNIVATLKASTFQVGNQIEDVLFLVAEAALDPIWLSLFLGNQNEEEINSENVSREKIDSSSGFFSNFSIVSQIELRDVILVTPLLHEEGAMCVICEKTNLSLGILRNHQEASTTWLETFCDDILGLHVEIVSRQKIVLSSNEQIQKKKHIDASPLVQSFEINSYLHPLHGQGKVQDINLTTKDIIALDKLSDSLLNYKRRVDTFTSKLSKLAFPMTRGLHTTAHKIAAPDDPVTAACDRSKESIKKARLLVDEMNASVSALKDKIGASFAISEQEIKKTRVLLFKKENERFSAYSLLTNDASGYLQVASSVIGSERLVSVTNFWRYWVVLKQNVIILYRSPTGVSNFIINFVNVGNINQFFDNSFLFLRQNNRLSQLIILV